MANFGAILHNLKLSKMGCIIIMLFCFFLHKTAGTESIDVIYLCLANVTIESKLQNQILENIHPAQST